MPRPSTNYKSQRNRVQRPANAQVCPECRDGWLVYQINTDSHSCPKCGHESAPIVFPVEHNEPAYPKDWTRGQLLNVRNVGNSQYRITLLGEEFDPDHMERCLFFTDSFTTQAFVSAWYSKEHVDPRA